jgi:predicted O-methyltransferase YrrM
LIVKSLYRGVLGACEAASRRLPGMRWAKVKPCVDPIEGFLPPVEGKRLFQMVRSLPERAVILEIGAYKGRSTCYLAFGCLGTKKHVYSIDTFCGNDTDFPRAESFLKEWKANIELCGLSCYVTPLIGLSREFYSSWSSLIHLLFIDGSHQYEDVLADFEHFFPHVVPGGIVAFHDVVPGWEGPYRVWNEYVRGRLQGVEILASLAYGRKPL